MVSMVFYHWAIPLISVLPLLHVYNMASTPWRNGSSVCVRVGGGGGTDRRGTATSRHLRITPLTKQTSIAFSSLGTRPLQGTDLRYADAAQRTFQMKTETMPQSPMRIYAPGNPSRRWTAMDGDGQEGASQRTQDRPRRRRAPGAATGQMVRGPRRAGRCGLRGLELRRAALCEPGR